MKKILLDTSVIIDFVRRNNKESTILFRLTKKGYRPCISILTHTEVYSGKSVWEQHSARYEVEKLFSGMEILPLESEISKKAGEIKAHSNSTLIDAIIAATALVHGLELSTLNNKDFEHIKNLRLFSEESLLS